MFNLLGLYCFLFALTLQGADGEDLFTSNFKSTRTRPACCNGEEIVVCDQVGVSVSALGSDELSLGTLNATVKFKGNIGDENSYSYKSDNIDMVLTSNQESGGVFGWVLDLSTGNSYTIEHCGSGVHVLKRIDVSKLPGTEGVDYIAGNNTSADTVAADTAAAEDTTTIVTYSVKIYYTPQFASATADINGFINQMIQITNQGYINTGVPLRVRVLCIEQATINDNYDGGTILNQFTNMKGSTAALRGTADAAALLVNSVNVCGIAWLYTISSGDTVSVTNKNCALSTAVFGHELGHNFGIHHNVEVARNPIYADGHGHLIAQGSDSRGYRTIMAYSASNHEIQVNVYSTPDLTLSYTGTPLGIAGRSNNVRILTQNRFSFAAIGDESQDCYRTTTSRPTTTQPPTTTQSPAGNCGKKDIFHRYVHAYKGTFYGGQCQAGCAATSSCLGWVQHQTYRWCYFLTAVPVSAAGWVSGPNLDNPASCYIQGSSSCSNPGTVLVVKYLGGEYISTADACHARCKQVTSCIEWKLVNGACYFYGAKYRSSSAWISGPKYC